MTDRFGILWRPERAAEICARLDDFDVLEVIADDWTGRSWTETRALRAIAEAIPLRLHGVGLGLASAERVDDRRLDALARLVGDIGPQAWSEHLGVVGHDGKSRHHSAPAWRRETIDATLRNVRRATRVVGSAPLLENVVAAAELPASTMNEADWTANVLDATGCRLVLDLSNLHANRERLGGTLPDFLDRIGAERVGEVHISSLSWTGVPGGRRLADELLAVAPEPTFEALRTLGAAMPRPLCAILETDGEWLGMPALLDRIERGRTALAQGRAAASAVSS